MREARTLPLSVASLVNVGKATRAVLQPHFLWHPAQLLRRVAIAGRREPLPEFADAVLPWGHRLRCRPGDGIGGYIYRYGTFDMHVSEAIWRLLDGDEVAVDAGANIGYMTSIMLRRVTARGTVIAVEPHREIADELSYNTSRWSETGLGTVIVRTEALSDSNGSGVLEMPADFIRNRGIARLGGPLGPTPLVGQQVVALVTLDDVFDSTLTHDQRVGVLKVDVEWHEHNVFRGAARSLQSHRIRDIIYEDHRGPESDAANLLRSYGYAIFHLSHSFSGLRVADSLGAQTRASNSADYLATLEPKRACDRLRPRGWRMFRG
jgi:FkbM family methyltransferase